MQLGVGILHGHDSHERSKEDARLFHALADETRLRILEQLTAGEQCVCDLTNALETAQSLLSFHLKALKDAGVVTDRRDGRWVYYALNQEALREVHTALLTLASAPPQIGIRCCE